MLLPGQAILSPGPRWNATKPLLHLTTLKVMKGGLRTRLVVANLHSFMRGRRFESKYPPPRGQIIRIEALYNRGLQ